MSRGNPCHQTTLSDEEFQEKLGRMLGLITMVCYPAERDNGKKAADKRWKR